MTGESIKKSDFKIRTTLKKINSMRQKIKLCFLKEHSFYIHTNQNNSKPRKVLKGFTTPVFPKTLYLRQLSNEVRSKVNILKLN